MTLLRGLSTGDEVYFKDPDHGISSSYYKVIWVLADPGEEQPDTVVVLHSEQGSELEAFLHELTQEAPTMRLEIAVSIMDEFTIDGPEAIVIENFTFSDLKRISELSELCHAHDLYSVQVWDFSPKPYMIDWDDEEPKLGEPYEYKIDLITLNVTKDSFFWKGNLKNSSTQWRSRHISIIAMFEETEWDQTITELE